MKRVLIVASVISFIEWFNKENINFLQISLGCEVHVACNFDYMEDTDIERTTKYIDDLKRKKIILHNIHFSRNPFCISNIKAYTILKKIIDKYQFDLIHCHTPAASVITRLAAKKARKNGSVVVYTCHGFNFHNTSSWVTWGIFYVVELIMSRYCDYLITINKEDFTRAQGFYSNNVRYIPGVGVDVKKFNALEVDKKQYRKKIGLPEDAVVLLSLGELIDRKNHEVIIKAVGKINNPYLYYVICGKGPLRKRLEKLSRQLKIEERVIFLGFREDIAELLCISDISAFPSKIEGLGLAGIESLAAGVPVISSNVHGIMDYMVNGKTGFTCDPEDTEGFAEAIRKLANSKELRLSMRRDCMRAAAPFDLSRALHAMWSIYEEILEKKRE